MTTHNRSIEEFVGKPFVRMRAKWYDQYQMGIMKDSSNFSHLIPHVVEDGEYFNNHEIFDGGLSKDKPFHPRVKYISFYEKDMLNEDDVYEIVIFKLESFGSL